MEICLLAAAPVCLSSLKATFHSASFEILLRVMRKD